MRAQASLPLRLGLLVAGIVLPLTVFATILVYYNYETSRRTAYDQVLQIARGVATNVDQEFRTAIASLQLLALSETLERGDLDGFRKQAEHFLEVHFPRSNVVVTDAGGQQLLNTAVPPGAPLPTYVRMDALRRVFERRTAEISGLLFRAGPASKYRGRRCTGLAGWQGGLRPRRVAAADDIRERHRAPAPCCRLDDCRV